MLPNGKFIYYQGNMYEKKNDTIQWIMSSENFIQLNNSIETLRNADVVIGEYNGNTSGSSPRQDINLGFRPRYVFCSGTMYDSVYFQMQWQYFSVASSSAGNDALYIIDTGFSVSNRSSSYTSAYLNREGNHYVYIAFR